MTLALTRLSAALLIACALSPSLATAQVEIVDDGETYIEMTPEELRDLVGKMQRLRAQRARQYAYLRARQEQREGQAPTTLPTVRQPAYVAPRTSAPTTSYDPRVPQLEREMADLATEMRLLREEMQRGLRQNPAPTTYATDQRRSYTDDSARDRELRDLRDRYERELREERDERRRLERELADARRDGAAYRRDLDRDRNTFTPAVVPVPVPSDDNGARDRELLARQDSLNRALAALRAEMAAARGRDTVIIERAPDRIVVRDTVRDTRVVTRTLAEERIDLAAVLFANNSSAINRAAELQIAQAIEAYRREPSETVILRGFASRTGNVEYNQALSQRRAEAVRDRLHAQGVPLDHIRIIANGVDPGDNLAEARRVEIQLLRRPR